MNLFNNKIIIFFIFLFISTSIFSQLDSTSIVIELKKKKEITRLYKDSLVKIIDSLNKQIKRFEKPAYVPIKHWRFSGRFFFDGTQILLNNWVAGGQNNTSLVGKILVSVDYKTKLLTIDSILVVNCCWSSFFHHFFISPRFTSPKCKLRSLSMVKNFVL